jgi:hypothetical protein
VAIDRGYRWSRGYGTFVAKFAARSATGGAAVNDAQRGEERSVRLAPIPAGRLTTIRRLKSTQTDLRLDGRGSQRSTYDLLITGVPGFVTYQMPGFMAQSDPILQEIESLDAELIPMLAQTASAWRLAELLPTKYPPEIVAKPPGDRARELAGLYLLRAGRSHEALGLFWAL